MKAEIHRKLITSKQALEKLGGRRETTAQQNEFLVAISMRFQEVTSLALNANYVGSDWFDQFPSLRFATAVVNRNDMLARVIDRFGHSYDLNADTSESGPQVNGPEEGYPAPSDDPDPMETGHSKESQGEVARSRTTIGHPDLIDLTVEQENYTTNVKSNTREWLTAVYRSSRGFELGTFDASILAMTMKTQSSKWEAIALGYISDVVNMAHMFVLKLLELLCPNPRICDELMSVLHEELMTTYKKACDHAKFLLRVERTNVPVTLNHYFNENLEKRYAHTWLLPYKTDTGAAVKHADALRWQLKLSSSKAAVRLSDLMTLLKRTPCPIKSTLYVISTISSKLIIKSLANASSTTYACKPQTISW